MWPFIVATTCGLTCETILVGRRMVAALPQVCPLCPGSAIKSRRPSRSNGTTLPDASLAPPRGGSGPSPSAARAAQHRLDVARRRRQVVEEQRAADWSTLPHARRSAIFALLGDAACPCGHEASWKERSPVRAGSAAKACVLHQDARLEVPIELLLERGRSGARRRPPVPRMMSRSISARRGAGAAHARRHDEHQPSLHAIPGSVFSGTVQDLHHVPCGTSNRRRRQNSAEMP